MNKSSRTLHAINRKYVADKTVTMRMSDDESEDTNIELLDDTLSASSSSTGSSSDSYITEDSSTAPSKFTSSEKSFDRNTNGGESDDMSELTDPHINRGSCKAQLAESKVRSFGTCSLNTQKLVQNSSDVHPEAFRSTLKDFRGIISDSSCSSSPWVDSSDSSSFGTLSERELARKVAGSRAWAHRIVVVAKETSRRQHDSEDIESCIDARRGEYREETTQRQFEGVSVTSAGIEIASNANELSTVEPMDRNVARQAFVKDHRRNKTWRERCLGNRSDQAENRPIPKSALQPTECAEKGMLSWRQRTIWELFFLIVTVTSLVCLVVLLAIILRR